MRKIAVWLLVVMAVGLASLMLAIQLLGEPKLNEQPITILAADGEELGTVYSDGERIWRSLEQLNPLLVEATIAIEDQNFYHHGGFDLKRIGGAVVKNFKQRNLAEGASTISQQYARNLYLTHEKTWTRKIKEAFYTIRLEHYFDKDQLLEGYLNTIYYGHGIYGVETASQFFFNKPTTELTLAEIALLVAIPNRPNANSPIKHFETAKQQQEKILSLLMTDGLITEADAELAKLELLEIVGESRQDPQFGYIAHLAIQEASVILGEPVPAGFKLHTTIESDQQAALNQAVTDHIGELQVGAIMSHPATGAIKALIGGVNYQLSPFNRATQAKRMVGSTFKPFIYYTALENGFTAATPLMSEPTTFAFSDDSSYSPSNFNHLYADHTVTLAQALAVSDNIYAVKTHLFLTPEKVIDRTRTLGITSELANVPALALGTASISVREMVTAYSHFANGGHQVEPFLVEKILDPNDEVVYQRAFELGEQMLDERLTFILNQLLTGMFDPNLSDYLAVTGGSISGDLTGDYAGKSGSTNTDHWMIGYSPELIVGVWTGYDDNRPIGSSQAAKLIWRDAIEAGHKKSGSNSFIAPPGIVAAYVDPQTGLLSDQNCPVSRLMFFVKGTEPIGYCDLH
ncbi:transglycosylase domain-containing protein [Amphibacillus indicireducens]|uniref:PBP1A family penicillin-binding protein n=1 Tax=Amphibacillus indicireducens TaxID=1076330 RepID=A0ABP7W093_9BACI